MLHGNVYLLYLPSSFGLVTKFIWTMHKFGSFAIYFSLFTIFPALPLRSEQNTNVKQEAALLQDTQLQNPVTDWMCWLTNSRETQNVHQQLPNVYTMRYNPIGIAWFWWHLWPNPFKIICIFHLTWSSWGKCRTIILYSKLCGILILLGGNLARTGRFTLYY